MANILSKKDSTKPVETVKEDNNTSKIMSNAAPEKTFEEREKIEAEVEMIKIGRDRSGRWQWKRSDKLTAEDKEKRAELLANIRKGLPV